MKDQLTKANINLNGILRSLEHLCYLDNEAHSLIVAKNVTILFIVKKGPAARLIFKNDKCVFQKGTGRCHIKLWFSSPEHFNAMMDGEASPIILKGFTKKSFLKNEFARLTKRLEYYLKPRAELLQDDYYRIMNTVLSFYTTFNSLAEVGMHDPMGKEIIAEAKSGIFCTYIEDTEYQVGIKISQGQMETVDKFEGSPVMYLIFKSLETTYEILNGTKDYFSAIGFGKVQMKGFMPLMQSIRHLVPLLNTYLK